MSTSPIRHRSRSSLVLVTDKGAAMNKTADPKLGWAVRLAVEIEYREVAELRTYARNPRTHSKKQIRKIAACIREFGFVNPIVVDETGEILVGHGRLAAAELLGLETVPVVRLCHLSAEQKRAYRIADNRIAELAGWDERLLALKIETHFEIEILGFETAEIDRLVDPPAAQKEDALDETEAPAGPVVSKLGDLWLLGRHRLLCDDARDSVSYKSLLAGEKAQMVFTDPPYNVRIDGHVCGLGRIQHREFPMASGEMSKAEFIEFLKRVLGNLAHATIDGAIHFICMDWRHMLELLTAGYAVYHELKNVCVWAKDNGGLGSFYRSRHEMVFVFKHGTAPHTNTFGLGETGRYRTNVWEYAGANTLRPGRQEELAMHPTVKPVALVADAIKDCSRRGDIVLDAFGGSGTTIIAAEKTGRRGHLLELDPVYVDVTIRRWQKRFGRQARHAGTGLTFDEMAAKRIKVETPNPSNAEMEAGHE
jgi:DNA modification methylase